MVVQVQDQAHQMEMVKDHQDQAQDQDLDQAQDQDQATKDHQETKVETLITVSQIKEEINRTKALDNPPHLHPALPLTAHLHQMIPHGSVSSELGSSYDIILI